jgi:hypothetical protein
VSKKITKSDLIQYDTRIGSIQAENDDEFLFECFVDNRALSIALDVDSHGSIISGRTGSGKTAILRYIEKKKRNYRIEPSEMALEYISNSDIFRFLSDIGADLDIIFQTIWKHVLCLQYIRMRYNIESEEKSQSWLKSVLSDFLTENSEKKAIEYLRQWGDKFWISVDENVKHIVSTLEEQINLELGLDINKFKSRAGYGKNLNLEQKTELISRARKVIDSKQLRDLSLVLDLLKKVDSQNKWIEPCYILIDNLDERWIDDSIKYRMINSLVEALKSFRKIDKLKIIVALRTDVIERSIQENASSGFQREKFKDYIIDIRWSDFQLKQIVEQRIKYLYKRKYTSQNVLFSDIFDCTIAAEDPFKYMLDRTLMRRRDIIAFVNACLQQAENKVSVNSGDIKAAERNYSIDRRQALIDEWRTAVPSLEQMLKVFNPGQDVVEFDKISTKEFWEEIALPICTDSKDLKDPSFDLAAKLFPDKGVVAPLGEVLSFGRHVFATLHRVGAIGVKRKDSPYEYYFLSHHLIPEEEIQSGYKFRLVKMLNRALGVNDSEQRGKGRS